MITSVLIRAKKTKDQPEYKDSIVKHFLALSSDKDGIKT